MDSTVKETDSMKERESNKENLPWGSRRKHKRVSGHKSSPG